MVNLEIRSRAEKLCCGRSLKTSIQRSAFSSQPKRRAVSLGLRPSADLGLGLGRWDWVALGWPKGGPRATQAWRKGHPSVEWNKWFCLQQELKKRPGWGVLAEGDRQRDATRSGDQDIR
jgi:hypothetical protein